MSYISIARGAVIIRVNKNVPCKLKQTKSNSWRWMCSTNSRPVTRKNNIIYVREIIESLVRCVAFSIENTFITSFMTGSCGMIDLVMPFVMGSYKVLDPARIFVMRSSRIIDPSACCHAIQRDPRSHVKFFRLIQRDLGSTNMSAGGAIWTQDVPFPTQFEQCWQFPYGHIYP